MGFIKNETCLFFILRTNILNTRERDKEILVSGTALIPEKEGGREYQM